MGDHQGVQAPSTLRTRLLCLAVGGGNQTQKRMSYLQEVAVVSQGHPSWGVGGPSSLLFVQLCSHGTAVAEKSTGGEMAAEEML